MRLDTMLLGLPASLILLVTSQSEALLNGKQTPTAPWASYFLPSVAQEAPQYNTHEGQAVLEKAPVGVMKMSDDPGEMFYMEYWQYEENLVQGDNSEAQSQLRTRDLKEEVRIMANASISYRPPFKLHTDDELAFQELSIRRSFSEGAAALAALKKRDFTCPVGTSDCSAIGAPNACCATGETCFSVTDTGLGNVGCCPDGASCGGTISACNFPNSPCANGGGNYQYGGCCIPNYVCAGVGCKCYFEYYLNQGKLMNIYRRDQPQSHHHSGCNANFYSGILSDPDKHTFEHHYNTF
jgi:hypothetical protein